MVESIDIYLLIGLGRVACQHLKQKKMWANCGSFSICCTTLIKPQVAQSYITNSSVNSADQCQICMIAVLNIYSNTSQSTIFSVKWGTDKGTRKILFKFFFLS